MPKSLHSPWNNGSGVLVEPVKSLAAVSSYSVAIPAATYRRLEIYVSGLGGMSPGVANGVLVQLNGDTVATHYSWIGEWWSNSTTAPTPSLNSSGLSTVTNAVNAGVTGSSPSASYDATIKIRPIIGRNRSIDADWSSLGSSAATDIEGKSRGWWLNTVADVTAVNLIFGSAFTGTVETRGVQL